jgi:hypothetical protein
MAIKFLSGQTITGSITVSANVQAATFNSLAINTTGVNNVANQIVRTESNGYANFGWINSVSGNHTGSITRITASNDAYLRYVTPAQFRTGVTDGFYAPSSTVSGVTSVATGNGLTGGTIISTGTLSMSGSYTGSFSVAGAITSTGLINGRGISSGQSGESNIANVTGETWIGSNGLRYNTGAGTFARSSATSQAAMIVLTDTADTEFYAQPSTSQSGTYALTPKMVIKGATGRVGIGTTSPDGPLHVKSNNTIVEIESSGNLQNSAIGFTTTTDARYEIGTNISGGTNFELYDRIAGTARISFMQGGTVGIGTLTPVAKLEVAGSLKVTAYTPSIGASPGVSLGYNSAANIALLETWGSRPLQIKTYGYQAFYTNGVEKMRLTQAGDFGIGIDAPIEKLQVEGGAYINGRDIGKGVNLATSQGWTALSAGNVNSVLGYFGGNFSKNGASNENEIIWGSNHANQRSLIWKSTNNDTGSDGDGGWDKGISTGNDNMGYMSYVYVKRTNASTNGSFYFGCSGGNTLNLAGTAIGNPYFIALNVGTFPLNVWCLAIGHIQANNDSNTVNNGDTGIWRLDTGIKIGGGTSYKMGTNGGSQSHRTYLYYSTDPASTLSWVDPGFYAIDGTQPTMGELLNTNGLPSVSEASLWTRKTLDSNVVINGNIAITALTHTYTYPAPHALYISGGFTTTPASSGVTYSAHINVYVDGTNNALIDQHDTPPAWWRQGFAFMTQDFTSGSHTITVNALNQNGNFNIVGGGGGGGGIYSQIVYRIIPL